MIYNKIILVNSSGQEGFLSVDIKLVQEKKLGILMMLITR
jgi:hypothetical protein